MRESSHQSKYIWGYWSCKAAGGAGTAQFWYLVNNNSSNPKKSLNGRQVRKEGEALSIYLFIYL